MATERILPIFVFLSNGEFNSRDKVGIQWNRDIIRHAKYFGSHRVNKTHMPIGIGFVAAVLWNLVTKILWSADSAQRRDIGVRKHAWPCLNSRKCGWRFNYPNSLRFKTFNFVNVFPCFVLVGPLFLNNGPFSLYGLPGSLQIHLIASIYRASRFLGREHSWLQPSDKLEVGADAAINYYKFALNLN